LTGRQKGEAPYTLLSFFPAGYLTIIDESHVTVPQLNGMYAGDRSRKSKLVDYGFRLPSALDNRPLNFAEIQERLQNVLYVSATPAQFEVLDSQEQVTSLLVRPTGLIDPQVIIKKVADPVQDMLAEIKEVIDSKNRVLVTTLTKKMSEKLADFLALKGIRCAYLHSEIKALDRVKIIRKLRQGEFDVLIGINLLREGLDLPEVSLVIILDADKEGFLRSSTALIQTFGRAARHIDGKVILYIDDMVKSVRNAIAESERRRNYQLEYNKRHAISPISIFSPIKDFSDDDYWLKKSEEPLPEDFQNREALEKEIQKLTSAMKKKAASLDFKSAAQLRDRIKVLKNMLIEMF
jgi:excinuclease ABC subunit B